MTAKTHANRPKRPYGKYSLRPAPNGQWRKKVKGKQYYLGPWSEPLLAEQRYEEILRTAPQQCTEPLTIAELCTAFIESSESKHHRGELSKSALDKYDTACRLTVSVMGRDTLAADVGPEHFRQLRKAIGDDLAPTTLSQKITICRLIWNFAERNQYIDRRVAFGDDFTLPPSRTIRKYREEKRQNLGAKFFEPAEIEQLLSAADDRMKAAILTGLNAAYGPEDLLHCKPTNLNGRWLEMPRGKTGIARKAYLWDETFEAINKIKTGQTIFGVRQWGTHNRDVTYYFRKLQKEVGCYRRNRGFYALRSTFRTVADANGDRTVIDSVMGHADNSMGAIYRQHIDDERYISVSDYVRRWLFE